MIHDFAKKKLIHPMYVVGIAAMLAMRLMLPLGGTEMRLQIAGRFVQFYQPS